MRFIEYIEYKIKRQGEKSPMTYIENLMVDMKADLQNLRSKENGQEIIEHIGFRAHWKTIDALKAVVCSYKAYCRTHGYKAEKLSFKCWN